MQLVRVFGFYAVLMMALGEKDYSFQSGRQVDIGIGFKNSKLR